MTAGSGEPGETPQNQGWTPDPGTYEYPEQPVYGGYPPPPQASGGYPPPPPGFAPPPESGYPYPVGYGYPTQQAGTNSLAIFSLVASVVGLVPFCGFISSIIGIVLGAIAIIQIKRTRQGGYGLAVAGIVVGVATLAVGLIITTYAFT
jgi:hypothetical protein